MGVNAQFDVSASVLVLLPVPSGRVTVVNQGPDALRYGTAPAGYKAETPPPVGSFSQVGTVAAGGSVDFADDVWLVASTSHASVAVTGGSTVASLGADGFVPSALSKPYGLAIGRGACVVPVGVNQKTNAGTLSNGTDTTANFEFFVPLVDSSVGAILPVFTGWQGLSDTDNPNDIVFSCAVKMSDGTIQPFTFNGGSHTATLKAGAILIPDAPLAFGLQVTPAGQPTSGVWMRTHVDVSAQGASAKWYENNDARLVTGGSGELGARGSGLADLTLAGSAAISGGSNGNVFGPALVLGNPRGTRKPIICTPGNSIWEGAQDSSLTYGFISRAARALGYPIVKIAKGNETANNFATLSGRKYRMALLDGCTHAFCGYGTNDLVGNGRTAAQVQADMVTIWKALDALGIYVCQATVPPRSTGAWTLVDGSDQTASGAAGSTDPVRLAAVNGWLRAGAPLDPVALTPVAVGTAGAVLIGSSAHPCNQIFDFNSYCDLGVDTAKWKADGTAGRYTTDGTHPRPAMHQGTLGNLLADTTALFAGWSV